MSDFYFGAAAKSNERLLSDTNIDEKPIQTSDMSEVDAADGVWGGNAGNVAGSFEFNAAKKSSALASKSI